MRTLFAFLLMTALAVAQETRPDPAFMAKAIAVLQQQRNQALDYQAAAEAREATLKDEVARLKARVEELEKAAAMKEK